MSEAIIILFLLCVFGVLLVIGIPFTILILYRSKKRKGKRSWGLAVLPLVPSFIVGLFIVFFLYIVELNSQPEYICKSNFEIVTGMHIPNDALLVKYWMSEKHFTGDYSSACKVKIDKLHYQSFKNGLAAAGLEENNGSSLPIETRSNLDVEAHLRTVSFYRGEDPDMNSEIYRVWLLSDSTTVITEYIRW